MSKRGRAAAASALAFTIGVGIAASSAPADEAPSGWNDHLTESELALSLAACEMFGKAADQVSWCAAAAEAAASNPEIEELAVTAEVSEDGGEITATIPGSDSVLVTTIPGEG